LRGEIEFEVGRDDLDSVGHSVGAEVLSLEQIDHLIVLANIERPVAIDILSEAVDRLVSGDGAK
jgi:hypothetical protein